MRRVPFALALGLALIADRGATAAFVTIAPSSFALRTTTPAGSALSASPAAVVLSDAATAAGVTTTDVVYKFDLAPFAGNLIGGATVTYAIASRSGPGATVLLDLAASASDNLPVSLASFDRVPARYNYAVATGLTPASNSSLTYDVYGLGMVESGTYSTRQAGLTIQILDAGGLGTAATIGAVSLRLDVIPADAVPEPGSAALALTGLGLVVGAARLARRAGSEGTDCGADR